jgi:hypothetical protein
LYDFPFNLFTLDDGVETKVGLLGHHINDEAGRVLEDSELVHNQLTGLLQLVYIFTPMTKEIGMLQLLFTASARPSMQIG